MRVINLPMSCANLDCPNAPGEGLFKLVHIEVAVPVSSATAPRRDVRLYLCGPCANNMADHAIGVPVRPPCPVMPNVPCSCTGDECPRVVEGKTCGNCGHPDAGLHFPWCYAVQPGRQR